MGGNLCRPVATQFAESYTNKYYSVGTSCMNGRRKEMEDQHTVELNLLNSETSFFGVFDGHGGTSTSMFLKNHLHNYVPLPFEINDSKEDKKSELLSKLTKNMIEVDHQILSQSQSKEKDDSGSTAGFVLLKPNCNNYFDILVAHVGDSRVMVLGNDGKIKYKTNDHKPLNPIEHERIINAGGFVSYKNRINGNLAVSRAFGDASYKQKTDLSLNQQLVIAEPDIFTDTKICYNDIIILACDGIFEKLDYEQVADFVHTSIAINKKDVTTTCIDLINHSLELGSQDNMSVIIIKINNVAGEDLMAELARQKEKTRQKENELEQKRLNCSFAYPICPPRPSKQVQQQPGADVKFNYEYKFIPGKKISDREADFIMESEAYREAFIKFIKMNNLSVEDVKCQILNEWNLDENSELIKYLFKEN